ncbi:MAG: hypothetical protein KAG20_07100 [Cocleimonas sp.]|nr:hypothetical protein [Cocleimonas sp.]
MNRFDMNKKRENLWTGVAVLVFIGLLVVSYFYKNQLRSTSGTVINSNAACDLRQGVCSSALPRGGRIHFSMMPNSLPLLKPIALQVDTEGVEVSNVSVDFKGVGMDMGPNKVHLTAQKMITQFKGKTLFPTCSHQKMEWQANVLLTTKQGVINVPFHFYTLKNNE